MGYERFLNFSKLHDLQPDRYLHNRLKNFDLNFYRHFPHFDGKSDLLHLSDEDLLIHFIHRGKLEGRPYNRFFHSFIDPDFYKRKYPEFGDDLDSDAKALRHWMYYGVFEYRIPNSVVQRLIDAKFHLFQMGKVGSKSIQKAIAATGHQLTIPHIHFLNDFLISYPDSFYSYEEIISIHISNSINFISGVREPISRLLSGMLQASTERYSSESEASVDELLGSKDRLQERLASEMNLIVDWFSHQYFCGIDVYQTPFDVEAGWSVVNGDMHSVFLYRQDKLDNCWGALSKYTELNLIPEKINVTEEKNNKTEIHKRLFSSKFDEKFLSKVFGSKYCRHFFNAIEIEALKRKWSD